MGGYGSGNWYRYSKKDTTNDYYRWEIKKLIKDGFLQEGTRRSGTSTWSTTRMGEKRIGSSISFTINTLESHNSYTQVQYTNKKTKEEFDYKIRLTTTAPHYGGKRWWWICPIVGCNKRVGVLYLTGRYFACRCCLKLAYESQNESPSSRFLTKAQDIHERLGGSGCMDDWVDKPKGMHWKTYNRLVEEMEEYHHCSWMMIAKKFGFKLGGTESVW